jgi:hypothetical protein
LFIEEVEEKGVVTATTITDTQIAMSFYGKICGAMWGSLELGRVSFRDPPWVLLPLPLNKT